MNQNNFGVGGKIQQLQALSILTQKAAIDIDRDNLSVLIGAGLDTELEGRQYLDTLLESTEAAEIPFEVDDIKSCIKIGDNLHEKASKYLRNPSKKNQSALMSAFILYFYNLSGFLYKYGNTIFSTDNGPRISGEDLVDIAKGTYIKLKSLQEVPSAGLLRRVKPDLEVFVREYAKIPGYK